MDLKYSRHINEIDFLSRTTVVLGRTLFSGRFLQYMFNSFHYRMSVHVLNVSHKLLGLWVRLLVIYHIFSTFFNLVIYQVYSMYKYSRDVCHRSYSPYITCFPNMWGKKKKRELTKLFVGVVFLVRAEYEDTFPLVSGPY